MRGRAALATLALAAGAARAQEADPHAAQPERPTVATHAYTVAPGYGELEFGIESDRLGDARAFSTPTTFKVGLARRLQVEATASWVRQSDGGSQSGVSDLAIALKWRVADSLPVLGHFALQPAVRLPTGSALIGANAVVGSLLLISSQHVGPVEIDANFGVFTRLSAAGDVPATQTLWTVSAGGPARGALGWTAECYGYPGTGGIAGAAPIVALLLAPTYQMHDWFVLDAGVIVPLSGPQPHALFAGLTWNVGRLWRAGGANAAAGHAGLPTSP
jgi:hypothetical protein